MLTNSQKLCYTRPEYIQSIINFAEQAKDGDYIAVATMGFKPKYPLVHKLLVSLASAAERGANVTFIVDAFALTYPDGLAPGPLWYKKSIANPHGKAFKLKYKLLHDLEQNGGKVTVTNQPKRRFSVPVAGRSHIKFAVLGNDVFIGGCNLTDPDEIDAMLLRPRDAKLTKIIKQAITKISDAKLSNVLTALGRSDIVTRLDSKTTLMIDTGVRDQSEIEKRALKIIKHAKNNIYITLQYPPYGALLRTLESAAKHGRALTILSNRPTNFSSINRILTLAHFTTFKLSKVVYNRPTTARFVHAKVLITDSVSMIGSHNFVNAGVRLGTAEIALLSTDPSVAKELKTHIESQL